MNDVDIYTEFLTLKSVRNLRADEIANAAGVTTRTVSDWKYNMHIPDKYLDSMVNHFKDAFFTYAVFCYKYNYPFIDFKKRYHSDSLSMILACVKESHDTDLAFTDLESILSQVQDEDVVRYSKDVKEIIESASISLITSIYFGYKNHMTPKLVMMEGRE